MSTTPRTEDAYFHHDTPRTNPEVYEFSLSANPDYDGPMFHVQASFARKLERESDTQQARADRLEAALNEIVRKIDNTAGSYKAVTELRAIAAAALGGGGAGEGS